MLIKVRPTICVPFLDEALFHNCIEFGYVKLRLSDVLTTSMSQSLIAVIERQTVVKERIGGRLPAKPAETAGTNC